jgi:outer membrane protein assembly factor BamB
MRLPIPCRFVALLTALSFALADDWPEWRGKGRRGEWHESGILEKFPESGLKFRWRAPLCGGYAGPAVADGRVFVTDFQATNGLRGIERALCLEEKTGKRLWARAWAADYAGLGYPAGPRATPTVDGGNVYVVGAMGALHCLDVRTGDVRWRKDYVKDYGAQVPVWGIAGAPLVDGDRLICLVGGDSGATVVAFDKLTGRERWRGLPAQSEPGYCQPVIVEAGGARQLIIWHPMWLASLDPQTGKEHWRQPFKIRSGLTVATPVRSGNRLFISAFYNGPMMLQLAQDKPAARVLWRGESQSEIETDTLHALICTPVIKEGFIYGVCSYGQFRCLNAATGERVWETLEVTRERARWATAFIVPNGGRFFINNDRGELMIADLTPQGYHEISRTPLIKPTNPQCGRRELRAVNWTHPAYANRHIFTRNDEEILCASLEK